MSNDTQTATLSDFLLARIAEDVAVASPFINDLGDTRPWAAADVGGDVSDGPNPLGGDGRVATATTHLAAVHIARHDPARVLADVAAKRRIVELHNRFGDEYPDMAADREFANDCITCDGAERQWPCPTLRALAAPYADHPAFQEEWR